MERLRCSGGLRAAGGSGTAPRKERAPKGALRGRGNAALSPFRGLFGHRRHPSMGRSVAVFAGLRSGMPAAPIRAPRCRRMHEHDCHGTPPKLETISTASSPTSFALGAAARLRVPTHPARRQ